MKLTNNEVRANIFKTSVTYFKRYKLAMSSYDYECSFKIINIKTPSYTYEAEWQENLSSIYIMRLAFTKLNIGSTLFDTVYLKMFALIINSFGDLDPQDQHCH